MLWELRKCRGASNDDPQHIFFLWRTDKKTEIPGLNTEYTYMKMTV